MDKRAWKKFMTKRSSIWTLSLCMTGILVLGGIAAVDKTRRSNENSSETELGQVAYLEEELDNSDDIEDELFPTLEEKLTDDAKGTPEEGMAANADGAADGLAANVDGTADSTAANADGTADGLAASADGSTADGVAANANGSTADSMAANADGSTSDGLAANADGSTADSMAANADGSAADSLAANADESAAAGTAAGADEDAAQAASAGVISEQALVQEGIQFTDDSSLLWPSAGSILIDYSMDGSVYFPTLNQYKYNPALIIGSEVGNQVLAAAKGVVESVSIDEETGNTLVMNLGNGYRLTYGQLKELSAAQGDVVEAGEVLGYVSEPTKYYNEEGGNLYFAMTKDGAAVDPVLYLE